MEKSKDKTLRRLHLRTLHDCPGGEAYHLLMGFGGAGDLYPTDWRGPVIHAGLPPADLAARLEMFAASLRELIRRGDL